MCDYKELIEKYFFDGKAFDDDCIENLIVHVLCSERLSDFVRSVEINFSRRGLASYYPKVRKLVFNPKAIYLSSFNLYPRLGENMDKKSLNRFFNCNFLIALFHELEHARQTKIASSPILEKDSLRTLIDEGIEFGSRLPDDVSTREKIIYSFFHSSVLTERDADITAFLKILSVNDELDILNSSLLSYFNKDLLDCCVENYHYTSFGRKLISPSEVYYRMRGKKEDYRDITFDEDYDSITKLSWGMPIDTSFYNKLLQLRKKGVSDNSVKKKILKIDR